MKTLYLPSFLTDLKALKSTRVFQPVKALAFEEIPRCSTLDEIRNLTKLTGYDDAYRIRVGDYWLTQSVTAVDRFTSTHQCPYFDRIKTSH